MYELVQVARNTYYINSPAKIGLYVDTDGVYLIDSGNDKEAGRKIRQILDKNNWKLKAILNTHSHADHIGGNAYLQKQTGCKIYCSQIEAALIDNTVIESTYLFGGYSSKEMRNKFLMAQPSVSTAFDDDFPEIFQKIQLKGHCYDMYGYRTPDDVLFLGDCLNRNEVLAKYGIPFLYSVGDSLETFDMLETLDAKLFIPAHCVETTDISELIAYNRERTLEVATHLLEVIKEPKGFDDILSEMLLRYDLKMTLDQYLLLGSTIRSYLAWMMDTKQAEIIMDNSHVYWKAVQ